MSGSVSNTSCRPGGRPCVGISGDQEIALLTFCKLKKKKKKDLLPKWIFQITVSLKYFAESDTFNNINEKHYKAHSCQLENDLTTNLVVMSPEFIINLGNVFLEVEQNSTLASSIPTRLSRQYYIFNIFHQSHYL